jgi:hypothetical protein
VNWSFKAYLLRDTPTSLKFNNCTLCPQFMYMFCIYLRTNSNSYHFHHKLLSFYSRVEKRGANWAFIYSSPRFVFKRLTDSFRDQWKNSQIPAFIAGKRLSGPQYILTMTWVDCNKKKLRIHGRIKIYGYMPIICTLWIIYWRSFYTRP